MGTGLFDDDPVDRAIAAGALLLGGFALPVAADVLAAL